MIYCKTILVNVALASSEQVGLTDLFSFGCWGANPPAKAKTVSGRGGQLFRCNAGKLQASCALLLLAPAPSLLSSVGRAWTMAWICCR